MTSLQEEEIDLAVTFRTLDNPPSLNGTGFGATVFPSVLLEVWAPGDAYFPFNLDILRFQ